MIGRQGQEAGVEKKEILKSNYVVIDLSEEENKHTWTLTGWDEEQKPVI